MVCVAGEVCMVGEHAWQGVCMAKVGIHGRGRNAWQETCMAGGMCGRGHAWQGACMAGVGMHGRGHVWQGACMVGGLCVACTHPQQILRDTVNERVVCILLECILV